MKQRALLLLIFLPITLLSQIRGIVVDKTTGRPIEYANIWIENQNTGTTSDQNGNFFFNANINNMTLIVSSIGYENRRFKIDLDNLRLELSPKIYEIKEVIVRPKKEIELVVDDLKKASIHNTFTYICAGAPWMVAKYFKYLPVCERTPFLKKLKIITDSEIDSAKFNLRLIFANEKESLQLDILNHNLIITVQKGEKKTLIDLSEYHITIPKEGFYVSCEWLIIDSNKSVKSRNKYGFQNYNPSFVFIESNGSEENWIYTKGFWKKEKIPFPDNKDKHIDLAIELTLSD